MQPLASAIANAFDGTCKRLHQPSPPHTFFKYVTTEKSVCVREKNHAHQNGMPTAKWKEKSRLNFGFSMA